MTLPVKTCVDPVFIGRAVYYEKGGKTFKASRLESARPLTVAGICAAEFTTQNTRYRAVFTAAEKYRAFIDTCDVIGRLR